MFVALKNLVSNPFVRSSQTPGWFPPGWSWQSLSCCTPVQHPAILCLTWYLLYLQWPGMEWWIQQDGQLTFYQRTLVCFRWFNHTTFNGHGLAIPFLAIQFFAISFLQAPISIPPLFISSFVLVVNKSLRRWDKHLYDIPQQWQFRKAIFF